MSKFICTISLITFSQFAFASNSHQLNGQWVATDDKGNEILIEFSSNGEYHLWVNGESLTADIVDYGQIKYSVVVKGKTMTINLFDEERSKAFANLKAELKDNELRLSVLNGPGIIQNNGAILLKRVSTP